MDKVTGQCPQTTTFLKRKESEAYRTEILPLTSIPPYRWAKPAHMLCCFHSRMSTRTFRGRFIVQELCESRGGRPGLSVLTSLLVSVDVKIYCTVLRHWSQLVPNMSHDI